MKTSLFLALISLFAATTAALADAEQETRNGSLRKRVIECSTLGRVIQFSKTGNAEAPIVHLEVPAWIEGAAIQPMAEGVIQTGGLFDYKGKAYLFNQSFDPTQGPQPGSTLFAISWTAGPKTYIVSATYDWVSPQAPLLKSSLVRMEPKDQSNPNGETTKTQIFDSVTGCQDGRADLEDTCLVCYPVM